MIGKGGGYNSLPVIPTSTYGFKLKHGWISDIPWQKKIKVDMATQLYDWSVIYRTDIVFKKHVASLSDDTTN